MGLGSYNFDSHYVRRYAGRSESGDPTKDTIMREGRVKVQSEQLPPGAPTPVPAPGPRASYGCVAQRCVQLGTGKGGLDAGCGGACAALAADEWLAVRNAAQYYAPPPARPPLPAAALGSSDRWTRPAGQPPAGQPASRPAC